MDFATRDRYRHVVEKVAKSSRFSEGDVARHAIELAREGAALRPDLGQAQTNDGERAAHVGFYLVDRGLTALETRVQARSGILSALKKGGRRFTLSLYLGAIALLAALFTWSLVSQTTTDDLSPWLLVPLGILALLGTSHLAVALVNWLATLSARPQPLPRMDLSGGIPPEFRTLVVTPTLLTSAPGIEALVEALEVRFLANRDDSLHFGLLTDHRDAQAERLPGDEALVELAAQGSRR
jgi:cyclic beta-1,2-glucan synthetase